ncbi:unnamed protein product, partial [Ectocarpus sp. 12 AP-2014]
MNPAGFKKPRSAAAAAAVIGHVVHCCCCCCGPPTFLFPSMSNCSLTPSVSASPMPCCKHSPQGEARSSTAAGLSLLSERKTVRKPAPRLMTSYPLLKGNHNTPSPAAVPAPSGQARSSRTVRCCFYLLFSLSLPPFLFSSAP